MTYNLAWLSDQTALRCILVEVVANISGTETTLYLSNKGYVTKGSDLPANTIYKPYISGGISLQEQLSLDGNAGLSFGDIELDNISGTLDIWRTYVWSNRSVKVYVGDINWIRSDFQLIFDGIVSGRLESKDKDHLNLKIRDKLELLNTPLSDVVLGGSTTNANVLIPQLFGECFNVTPLLTNPSTLEYQVHGSEINGIIEVRDNGDPITTFTPHLTTGKFNLTAAAIGTITTSIQGDKNAGVYSNTISKLIQRIVTGFGKAATRLTSGDLDLTNLNAFDSLNTQPIGYYYSNRDNIITIINLMASSIGAQVLFNRLGKLTLVQIAFPPTGTPTYITSKDFVEDSFNILQEVDVKSSVKVGYCKNWTIQEGIQTGIPDEHKKLFAEEYLTVTQSDNTTETLYKFDSEPVQRDSLLLKNFDAINEGLRDLNIYLTPRTIYQFEGFAQCFLLTLGQTVNVTFNRYGLDAGKLGIVVKLETDWINFRVIVGVLI